MIRLGLRLSLRGAREGKIRLLLTALGVALAVALLLLTMSGFNALKARDMRGGWQYTSENNRAPSVDESQSDPLLWRMSTDQYDGRPITRVEVAATGPASPLLPGLDRLPAPGEYYVSPALAELLDTTPTELLGARFAGARVGTLGEGMMVSPDSLIVVLGRSQAQMDSGWYYESVRSIETSPVQHDWTFIMRIVLGVGGIGLMLPVLVFVTTSTRLAAARREERLAALRLVGATPGQVNVFAAVEAMLAAVAGTALGFALFYAFRPLVALVPFTGERFFTDDLSLGPLGIVAAAVGVPVAAVAAGLLTLRRVQVSPLGVTRKAPARRPSAFRMLGLVAGLLLLLLPNWLQSSGTRFYLVVVVFAGIGLGIAVAGPWLTYVGGRLLGALARKDSTLIAARRLSSDPRRAFRAISGLVLAVFVGTVFVTIVATALGDSRGVLEPREIPAATLVVQPVEDQEGTLLSGRAAVDFVAGVGSLEGVEETVPVFLTDADGGGASLPGQETLSLVSESDWTRLGGASQDLNGSGYVAISISELMGGRLRTLGGPIPTQPMGEQEAMTAGMMSQLLVITDGEQTSIERARTFVETHSPFGMDPYTMGEMSAEQGAIVNLLGRLVYVGVIISLLIAGCSLAVSVAGGLVERKRAFALLRLAGMPRRRLYRSVLLEAAVPLVLAAVISSGVGFLVAAMIIWNTGTDLPVALPGLGYVVVVVGGLAAALGVVVATLPLVGRMTAPGAVRME